MTTKTERLQLRITPELKSELQRRADEDGRTLANYVEWLIRTRLSQLSDSHD